YPNDRYIVKGNKVGDPDLLDMNKPRQIYNYDLSITYILNVSEFHMNIMYSCLQFISCIDSLRNAILNNALCNAVPFIKNVLSELQPITNIFPSNSINYAASHMLLLNFDVTKLKDAIIENTKIIGASTSDLNIPSIVKKIII